MRVFRFGVILLTGKKYCGQQQKTAVNIKIFHTAKLALFWRNNRAPVLKHFLTLVYMALLVKLYNWVSITFKEM